MADRTRTITIRVRDDFSRQLRELTRQLDGVGDELHDLDRATNNSRGFFKQGAQDLFYMANAAQQVYGAFSQVFSTANEWAKVGAGAERSKLALQSLVGSGNEYVTMITAVKNATRGAVTEGEAAATAYQVMRFGFAESAAEMEEFVRVASIIGAASPQLSSTSEAITEISMTLANMSFMRLDQLGISSGQVRDRMKELKAETEGMSTETAFQTAVMEQLTEQADALGDSILDTTDSQARLTARLREVKEDVGLRIAKGFEGAAIAIESTYEALTNLPPQKTLEFFVRVTGDLVGLGLVKDLASEISAPVGSFLDTPEAQKYTRGFDVSGEGAGALRANPMLAVTGQHGGGYGMSPEAYYSAYYGAQGRAASTSAYESYRAGQDYVNSLLAGNSFLGEGTNFTGAGRYGRAGDPMGGMNAYGRAALQYQPGPTQRAYQAVRAAQGGGFTSSATFGETGGIEELDAYIARQKELADVEERRAAIRTRAAEQGVGLGMSADDMGMGMVYETVANKVSPAFDTLTGKISGAMSALFELGESGELVGEKFASLDEKFGVVRDSFDVDVYNEMKSALDEAGVEIDTITEALTIYEHQTGMANAQTVLFDDLMGDLTEQLQLGNLTALEYAEAVQRLGQTDLSIFDAMLAPLRDSDFETYMAMLERLQTLDLGQLQAVQALPQNVSTIAGNVYDALFGGFGTSDEGAGVEGTSKTGTTVTDQFEEMKAQFEEMTTKASQPGTAFSTAFSEGVQTATESVDGLDTRLDQLTHVDRTVRIGVDLFQKDTSFTIPVTVEIDGREVANAVDDSRNRTNDARTPVLAGGR